MGDFNINFLNYESHTPTDDYINNWGGGVFCFQPHFYSQVELLTTQLP